MRTHNLTQTFTREIGQTERSTIFSGESVLSMERLQRSIWAAEVNGSMLIIEKHPIRREYLVKPILKHLEEE